MVKASTKYPAEGRFSPATSSTVGGEVGKDASNKVTVSADVVIQAFTPTSSNLHTVATGILTLPGRQGAAKAQQQYPHPAATPRDASQEKRWE
jgi:hypothetical protein